MYVFVSNPHGKVPFNDAFYYHYQAKLIVEGKGWFIQPFDYYFRHGQVSQSAAHPPLWTIVLALATLAGLRSYLSQLVLACVIGAGAVFVTGLAARKVAGRRAGLVAAVIAAIYPNYWLNYAEGYSETLLLLLIAAVMVASYRLWERPSAPRVGWLGFLCALAALDRAEQSLLVLVLLVPLVLLIPKIPGMRRMALLGLGALVAIVTVTPWISFNLTRFQRPELLSTEMGLTLAGANCHQTYYGTLLGSVTGTCDDEVKVHGDESQQDLQYRQAAEKFVSHHESRLPVVLLARVGRVFGLYRPVQEITLDEVKLHRQAGPAFMGLMMYYVLAVASVIGVSVLRRRRTTVVPFIGLFVEVLIVSMAFFGDTRYRVPLEVGLVVLAAVTIDAFLLPARRPTSVTVASIGDSG